MWSFTLPKMCIRDRFNYLKEHNIPFTIASASIKENIDFFVKTFNLNRWFDLNKIVYDDGSHNNKISTVSYTHL